ncbi:MAG: cupin domain-containing protein [Gemmatimonadales bacterium]
MLSWRTGCLAAALALGSAPGVIYAQQPTILLENESVRVTRIEYPAGAQGPSHTHHHPRTIYVVAGGTLELRAADGTATTVTLDTGSIVWRPPETHSVANRGDSTVIVVETEIKKGG